MAVVLDASVLVPLFAPQDPFHNRAIELFTRLQKEEEDIMIPSLALAEVVAAISRRTQKFEIAHAAMKALKESEIIRIEDVTTELATRAARLIKHAPLRGADSIYVALADVEDAVLYTFDKEQRERGKAVVETREP